MTLPPRPSPPLAGIGLRGEHHAEFLATHPAVAFVEVHSENFFGRGGRPLQILERVRRDVPLSLHGVGLSLGSADPLDELHLRRLDELARRMEPVLVSEHLCWSSAGGVHSNDLLPLPRTNEALVHVVARVQHVQERLGRSLLLENVSSYVEFAESDHDEPAFLAEVSRRSGCGLLLDVNNVFVSAHNHGFDARAWIDALPLGAVAEIHLAGFERTDLEGGSMLIDTHSRPVADAVWSLYEHALERFGAVPTLVEWDNDLPSLAVLLAEADRAEALITRWRELRRHALAA